MYSRHFKFRQNLFPQSRKRIYWFAGIGILLLSILFAVSWHRFFVDNSKWAPRSGGIYTESLVGKTRNFSPLSANATLFDLDLKNLMFAGLLKYNPTKGFIEDGLATLRIAENKKTYFLTLKNSAKFSNGEKVTIDDIIFTYENVIQNQNFNNKPLQEAFKYITLDVIDKNTVAFHLPEPNTFFGNLLTTPILRKKSYENALIEEINDPELPANKRPIGTGAYVLKNIINDPNGQIRVFLERNSYYFAGLPYIEKIVFYLYPNFETLQTIGNTHENSAYSFLSEYEVDGLSAENFAGNFTKREYVLPRFMGIFFNLDRDFAKNLYLRQALKLAVDKDSLLSKEKGWNRIDSVFFFNGIGNWQDKNFSESRQILREKNFVYHKKEDVRFYKDRPVELKMITSSAPAMYSRIGQNIARIWEKELSIKVNFEVLKPADFQQALQDRDYDLVLFGQNFSENPDALSTWHSSQSGKLNLANLTNKNIDFLIEEILLTGSNSNLTELDQKLAHLVPIIPIATPKYYLLVNKNLLGFSKTFGKIRQHAERFSGINNWYFEEKKVWNLPENKSKIFAYFSWLFSDKKEEIDYREQVPTIPADEKKD